MGVGFCTCKGTVSLSCRINQHSDWWGSPPATWTGGASRLVYHYHFHRPSHDSCLGCPNTPTYLVHRVHVHLQDHWLLPSAARFGSGRCCVGCHLLPLLLAKRGNGGCRRDVLLTCLCIACPFGSQRLKGPKFGRGQPQIADFALPVVYSPQ